MGINKFLKAAKVLDSNYAKEELAYSYEDENGVMQKDVVVLGIRKRTPAKLLQKAGAFKGEVDQFELMAGMVFLLDDDGKPTELTAKDWGDFDMTIVNDISVLIAKHRNDGAISSQGDDEGKN